MTRNTHILQVLAVTLLTLASLASLSPMTASAFEAHNPIESSLGSFGIVGSLAVDQSTGNVYAANNEREPNEAASYVEVFGPGGGTPIGSAPSSLTGAGSYKKSFIEIGGIAVDSACTLRHLSASECESFDPSNGDVYIVSERDGVIDKYRLNDASEYQYLCQFSESDSGRSSCEPGGEEAKPALHPIMHSGGGGNMVAVDSAGDLYLMGGENGHLEAIYEFNAAGEALQKITLPEGDEPYGLAVSSDGTLFTTVHVETAQASEVLELKRSSLTGVLEGEPVLVPNTRGAKAVAFDQASEQLFVDLVSSGEALNGGDEVVSRFGAGIMQKSYAIAVDEGTGEGRGDVYVANRVEHKIDVFGPGVPASLPAVDAPPPSLSDVTRTSALLSGTVNTGETTTSWQLEYVPASEYQPAATDPYAFGGSTAPLKLMPAAGGTSVGPVALTGLLAGTTYDYRLVATNELGTTDGPNHTFTTAAAAPPLVTTGAASEVTQTGVLLSGTVDTQELQTSYEFEVGTDTSYGGAKLFGNAGARGTEAVTASLQYLIPGTTYHYRLVASNEDGTTYGQDTTFTTPGVPAGITQPATNALIASPTVQFPSVAGAITKPQRSGKSTKKKTAKRRDKHKTGKRATGRHGAGHAKHRRKSRRRG